MKHLDAEHLTLLNTLLSRTEEFIEFFDRAETKMNTWRHEITQQATCQQTQFTSLKAELDRMESILSETGLNNFRIAAEETVSQDGEYLDSLKNTEQQLLRQIHGHRAELTRITQHAITQISHTTTQAVSVIEEKLAEHFPAPAPHIMHFPTESAVEEIIQPVDEPMNQETAPLKYGEWRSVTLTLVTTLLTAIIFGMYTSDEYPWEMHQQATSERGAGKVLLNAWPSLTQDEKTKILYRAPS